MIRPYFLDSPLSHLHVPRVSYDPVGYACAVERPSFNGGILSFFKALLASL